MIFTEEDKKLVRKFIEIRNRGYYCDGNLLTQVYNRVLEKNVKSTSCGSCLRQRVSELEKALKQWEAKEAKEAEIKAQEALKQEAPTDTKAEENNAPETKKKRGRPKKTKED